MGAGITICEEKPLDAAHRPPSPLRGPGLLPRWEEVRNAHAKRKSDRDFGRKQETWICYLERSLSAVPLLAFT